MNYWPQAIHICYVMKPETQLGAPERHFDWVLLLLTRMTDNRVVDDGFGESWLVSINAEGPDHD